MKEYPVILAIDTSCDDTSVALTQGMRVLSNVVASQTEIHRIYGGVYPLAAKLAHHELINPTFEIALKRAEIKLNKIDAVAVTQGPGLAIALEVGIEFAKQLSIELGKPLIAVNHMAGHLYSPLAVNSKKNLNPNLNSSYFPALALLVSGGHTELILLNNLTDYQIIGKTVDDAAGECLDKFARLLDLGYPGAAAMEEIAKKGNPKIYAFPLPMTQTKDLNFSFSGLKTAGRVLIEKLSNPKGCCAPIPLNSKGNKKNSNSSYYNQGEQVEHSENLRVLSAQDIANLSASFQFAVIKAIIYKLNKAIDQYQPKSLWIGGGVSANKELKKELRKITKNLNIPFLYPKLKRMTGDNAAMIGIAGYFEYQKGNMLTNSKDFSALQRIPRLGL